MGSFEMYETRVAQSLSVEALTLDMDGLVLN